jgi:membrane-associated phospholipid phosphatase
MTRLIHLHVQDRTPAPSWGKALREWLLPSRVMKRRILPPLVGLCYIGAVGLLGGLRGDHVLIGLLGLLDLYNEKTRRFLREFLPFILTGVIFDSMRYFYWPGIAGRVHVAGPYFFDRDWLGFRGQTWNEWFAAHHWPTLDLACGFAYLVYVGEFLALAMLLFFRAELAESGSPRRVRDARLLRIVALSFLVVNVLGFATYFAFPVAPPWYVSQYGLGPARLDIHPEAAAAARFDALLGTHFFEGMYGRGVDVYGAYPSLHVSYPFIALVVALRERSLRWARLPAAAFFVLMCVSAVYLQHHYVTDVILGVAYGAVALALAAQWSAFCASSAHPSASGSELPAASARRSA